MLKSIARTLAALRRKKGLPPVPPPATIRKGQKVRTTANGQTWVVAPGEWVGMRPVGPRLHPNPGPSAIARLWFDHLVDVGEIELLARPKKRV